MLPEGDVGGDTVLAVVEEDDPESVLVWKSTYNVVRFNIHGIRVHGLADEELVVLEIGNNLLGEGGGTLLELLDLVLAGAVLVKGLLDLLHVGCIVWSVPH